MTEASSSVKSWKWVWIKDNRLRPGWRLLLYLPVMAFIYFVLLRMPISALLTALHANYSYPIDQAVTVATVLLGTWLCRRFLDKRDMASLGYSFRRGWPAQIGLGVLLGAVLIGLIFIVELAFGWIRVTGFAWQTQPAGSFALRLGWAALNMVFVGIVEETTIRGYLLPTLEEAINLPVAVVISSSVFGLIHLMNPTASGWANYVIPFTLTLTGFLFAMAYLSHRSLWLPVALHFAWNFFEYDILALTSVPPERATFLSTKLTGSPFWVGLPNSSFGPEVSVLGVLAMLLGIGFFWYLRKRGQVGSQRPEPRAPTAART